MKKIKNYKNKEWLINEYINLKRSTHKIGKIYNVNAGTIYYWIKKFEIPLRTLSEFHIDKKQTEEHIKKRVESFKKTYQEYPEKWEKSEESKKKSSESHKGLKQSEEHKKKRSESMKGKKGDKSNAWKGGNVSVDAIHKRIGKIMFKSGICNICKKPEYYDKEHGKLELSNISGEYKTDLDDWQWVHHSCHAKWDKKNKIHKKKKQMRLE